ncbi:MAG: hypothetical protein WCK67_01290 [bacterium]
MKILGIPTPNRMVLKPIKMQTLENFANLDNYVTRLGIGAGAIAIEPAVDYYSNRKLSKEDRKYSVVKTCSKIIIGTLTGVAARYIGQKQGRQCFINAIKKLKPAVEELKGSPELAIKKIQETFPGLSKKAGNDIFHDIITPNSEVILNKKTGESLIKSGKKLADCFGDVVGVVTTVLFTLSLDIPVMNYSMNKVMSLICPEATTKHKKNGGH